MTHEKVSFENSIEYLRKTPYLPALVEELTNRRECALGQLRDAAQTNEVFSCVGRIDALDDLIGALTGQ